MKEKTMNAQSGQASEYTSAFCESFIEKIRLIAEREHEADQPMLTEIPQHDLRAVVSKVIEDFQQEIIRKNIWVRIYDDHSGDLPPLHPKACEAVAKIISSALSHPRMGSMLAYVEISFLISETGTVVTIENNGPSVSVDELQEISFLKTQYTNVSKGGYTVQATISDSETDTNLGQASIRCVANCFTRFTACFPH